MRLSQQINGGQVGAGEMERSGISSYLPGLIKLLQSHGMSTGVAAGLLPGPGFGSSSGGSQHPVLGGVGGGGGGDMNMMHHNLAMFLEAAMNQQQQQQQQQQNAVAKAYNPFPYSGTPQSMASAPPGMQNRHIMDPRPPKPAMPLLPN